MKQRKVSFTTVIVLVGILFAGIILMVLVNSKQLHFPEPNIYGWWVLKLAEVVICVIFGGLLLAAAELLGLVKWVFGKITFKKLPTNTRRFIKVLPSLKKHNLPFLRDSWRDRLSRTSRRK